MSDEFVGPLGSDLCEVYRSSIIISNNFNNFGEVGSIVYLFLYSLSRIFRLFSEILKPWYEIRDFELLW